MPKFFLSISPASPLGCISKPLAMQRNVNNIEEAVVSTISDEKTKSVKGYADTFEICASNNYSSRKH